MLPEVELLGDVDDALGVELVDELGDVLLVAVWSVAATLPEVELLLGEVVELEALGCVDDEEALGVVDEELGVVLVDWSFEATLLPEFEVEPVLPKVEDELELGEDDEP